MEKNVLFYLFALILIVTVVQAKICWKHCSGQFRKQSKGWFTYQKLIYLLIFLIYNKLYLHTHIKLIQTQRMIQKWFAVSILMAADVEKGSVCQEKGVLWTSGVTEVIHHHVPSKGETPYIWMWNLHQVSFQYFFREINFT